MANSSHGPRLATTSAVVHTPMPAPRVVRLGRPANDNFRPRSTVLRAVLVGLAAAATALLAAAYWSLN